MPDRTAATGFSRGFFGCFGVAAALACVAGVGLVLVAVSARTVRDREAAAAAAAQAQLLAPPHLVARCAEAARQAQARYGLGEVTLTRAPQLLMAGPRPQIRCVASTPRGPVVLDAVVLCADSVAADCAILQRATLARQGLALP
jgi:hypothetical protein